MAHVLGIGGVFLRCRDIEASKKFYSEQLGIELQAWGGAPFMFKNDDTENGYSLLSLFKNDEPYWAPSQSLFMLNLRVRDLDGLLEKLRKSGAELVGEPTDSEFGRFAWVIDPDGNKIELWEPPK